MGTENILQNSCKQKKINDIRKKLHSEMETKGFQPMRYTAVGAPLFITCKDTYGKAKNYKK